MCYSYLSLEAIDLNKTNVEAPTSRRLQHLKSTEMTIIRFFWATCSIVNGNYIIASILLVLFSYILADLAQRLHWTMKKGNKKYWDQNKTPVGRNEVGSGTNNNDQKIIQDYNPESEITLRTFLYSDSFHTNAK